MDLSEIKKLKVADLREVAKNRGIFDSYKYKKEELIAKISETYKDYGEIDKLIENEDNKDYGEARENNVQKVTII